jgi:hypothetical protein
LKAKLDAYLAQDDKLILFGEGGMWKERVEFIFDLGIGHGGLSPFCRDYLLPVPEVMYEYSHLIRIPKGESLRQICRSIAQPCDSLKSVSRLSVALSKTKRIHDAGKTVLAILRA